MTILRREANKVATNDDSSGSNKRSQRLGYDGGSSFFTTNSIFGDRLFHQNADIYVVQHYHKFAASVRNMMRMYATTRPGRNFVIIEGAARCRSLRAYGKCGFRAPRRRNGS